MLLFDIDSLLASGHPFEDEQQKTIRNKIQGGLRPKLQCLCIHKLHTLTDGDRGQKFSRMLEMCWEAQPHKRPTSSEVLEALEHIVPWKKKPLQVSKPHDALKRAGSSLALERAGSLLGRRRASVE
mmetsp:Transcript_40665/g.95069  ORF Transcript_40665/g.95069 Transcript_40665/m.95069 type:complete len:126 (-) Transcript_40665:340-717(-)